MLVLVVDDNAAVAETTAIMFEALGCEVETANTSVEVPERVRSSNPRMIIMDIGMPRMDGYELCRRLREAGHDNIVIIAHTGWGSDDDRVKARAAGFDDILVKPARIVQFEAIVEKYGT